MTKLELDNSPQESSQTKRIIAFDLDGTLATGNIWASLNGLAGITKEEDQEWVRQFEAQEISHTEWFKLLAGRHRESRTTKNQYESLTRSQAENNITAEARSLISDLLSQEEEICIVSGGVDTYVKAVAKKLGVRRWFANYILEFDEDGQFKDIAYIENGDDPKVGYLKKISGELRVPLSEIIFVGDSSNDLPAFQATGKGVYLRNGRERPALTEASWKQIDDLSEVRQYLFD